MNKFIYVSLFAILSCNNQVDKNIIKNPGSTINQKQDNSKYYTQQDTILITTETGYTLKYGKNDFNRIIDNHPEFFVDFPNEPDLDYFCNGENTEFGSEVGMDTYFILYAYFLQQKNGIDTFKKQRKKLIDIYSNINSLFQRLKYGGTYFGHQNARILGYAEYSVFLLSKKDSEKNDDITKQKELYIQSLRQLIKDESNTDFNTQGKEKDKRNKELNKIVDELNKLITGRFYLVRAKEFQYSHYEYY